MDKLLFLLDGTFSYYSYTIDEYSLTHYFANLLMDDFIVQYYGRFHYLLPESKRNRLAGAIRGRGAFRRFKDGIRQMGIEEQWYDYQGDAYKRMAIEWCEENGIEYEL